MNDEEQWNKKIADIHDRIDRSMKLEEVEGAHSFESRLVRSFVNTSQDLKVFLADLLIVCGAALVVWWILS